MVILLQGPCPHRRTTQQGREDLSLIPRCVTAAIEVLIKGMAEFFEQHRFHLIGGSGSEPGPIDHDQPDRPGLPGQEASQGTAHGRAIEHLQVGPPGPLDQPLTQSLRAGAGFDAKNLMQQSVIGPIGGRPVADGVQAGVEQQTECRRGQGAF